jgi:Ca2+-transporting ATPase
VDRAFGLTVTADAWQTSPSDGWHSLEPDDALAQLHSDRDQGLSAQGVVERRSQVGANVLEETSGRSPWQILLDQFTNIMLLMLIAVAVVSGVLSLRNHEVPKDAIAIFAIVILNGVLGYFQESRAEKALAALKQLSSPQVRVLRDGRHQEVPAQDLVPAMWCFWKQGCRWPPMAACWRPRTYKCGNRP